MHLRAPLLAIVFALGTFALPSVASAAIPFFGPIIPPAYATCPASWGLLITVFNNIIALLLTLAIVFVAPLMIAYAGFLFVVNPVDSAGISKAKGILTHTIVGIVIALAGWMIVDAIMAVLYNAGARSGTTVLGTWSTLINSGNIGPCISQAGAAGPSAAPPAGITVACSIPPLANPPFADPLAQQMEGGQTVVWGNTDARLKKCVDKFVGKVGGSVTSAYRPPGYQTHLWEIRDRWCSRDLRSNSNPACSSLKGTISAEVTKHFGSAWACGAVGATSRHTSGTGVDISGINHANAAVQTAARESCLSWRNYSNDPYHYDLQDSCRCD